MENLTRKQPRLSVGTVPTTSVWKYTLAFPSATTPDPVRVILVWMSPRDGDSDSRRSAGQTPTRAVDSGIAGRDDGPDKGPDKGLDERPREGLNEGLAEGPNEGLDEDGPPGASPKSPPSPLSSTEPAYRITATPTPSTTILTMSLTTHGNRRRRTTGAAAGQDRGGSRGPGRDKGWSCGPNKDWARS